MFSLLSGENEGSQDSRSRTWDTLNIISSAAKKTMKCEELKEDIVLLIVISVYIIDTVKKNNKK